jgi:hypothetical protein
MLYLGAGYLHEGAVETVANGTAIVRDWIVVGVEGIRRGKDRI